MHRPPHRLRLLQGGGLPTLGGGEPVDSPIASPSDAPASRRDAIPAETINRLEYHPSLVYELGLNPRVSRGNPWRLKGLGGLGVESSQPPAPENPFADTVSDPWQSPVIPPTTIDTEQRTDSTRLICASSLVFAAAPLSCGWPRSIPLLSIPTIPFPFAVPSLEQPPQSNVWPSSPPWPSVLGSGCVS